MNPTCIKRVIMPNPCDSWNPWLLFEAPQQLRTTISQVPRYGRSGTKSFTAELMKTAKVFFVTRKQEGIV
jgi:hypothetical protein